MALKLINPNNNYNHSEKDSRADFVGAMDELSDLEKWIQGIQQDPHSTGIREKTGRLILDDPSVFAGQPTDLVVKQLEEAYENSIAHIGGYLEKEGNDLVIQKGYVENNFDDMFDRLDTKNILSMIQNITLFNTNNKKINETIKCLRESQTMQRLDENTVHQFISEKMKEEAKHLQSVYFNYAHGNSAYTQALVRYFAGKNNVELAKSLKNIKGKTEESKLKKILTSSLEAAEDLFDDEEHLGDKSDIFEDYIRPYYLSLAKKVYPADKKLKKLKDDEDRVKRKDKLRELTTNPPEEYKYNKAA